MHTIAITDGFSAEVDLQLDDQSEAAQLGLNALKAKAAGFLAAAGKPLDQAGFKSCAFGPGFRNPSIALNGALTLDVHVNSDASFAVYTKADGSLFDEDGVSPAVAIGDGECWVCFGLDAGLDVALGATAPSGFGVSGESNQSVSFSTYTLIHREGTQFPTLQQGAKTALANFHLARDPQSLRHQPAGCIHTWDIAGSFTLTGSYALPLSINSLTLADAKLPLNKEIAVSPEAVLQVSGALQISGEFEGRSYRPAESRLQLGLYKKKQTDFTATLEAEAGVAADLGSKDLLAKLFSVLPGVNLKPSDLDPSDAAQMQAALKSALHQGLSIALNACCSASVGNEAAVLYDIDLTGDATATDAAIQAALHGDWRPLAKLPNARELRNLTAQTHEAKYTATLNLLGVYDAASISDFLRKCSILHNQEDGSVTITDKDTAKRISASAMPFLAKDDRLRQVLQEAFLATAVYSAAGTNHKLSSTLDAKLTSLVYEIRTNAETVKKNLLLGVALDLLSPAELAAAQNAQTFHYARFEAAAEFRGTDALRLFFSDVGVRTPRRLDDIKRVAREALASLLDRSSAVDQLRWQILNSDDAWSQMEAQQFPTSSPGSYSDWFDVTFWATAVAGVGPRLKAVLDALDRFQGTDPSQDATFMAQREALSKALADVARNSHAAFEKGWPIAVSYALCGRTAPVSFEAYWDGQQRVSKGTTVLAAAGGAKPG